MSLSNWFRDYLYIPLGGNRKGFAIKLINILIVFLVSGLWHGAALTFVAWGLWHGVFKVLEECILKLRKKKKFEFRMRFSKIAGIVATNIIVFAGWVLFRADHLYAIPLIAKNLFNFGSLSGTVDWIYGVMRSNTAGALWYAKACLAMLGIATCVAIALDFVMLNQSARIKTKVFNPLAGLKTPFKIALCVFMTGCLLVIGIFGNSGFIYYRF